MKAKTLSACWAFLLVAVFPFYGNIWRVVPSLISREVMLAYHLDGQGFAHLISLFYYIYLPMQLAVGLWVDRYAMRLLITAAIVLTSLGGFFFAHGSSFMWAIAGRLLFALGVAFAFIGSLKAGIQILSEKHFPLVVGLIMSACLLGALFADVVVSHMIETLGWRLTCYCVSMAGLLWALVFFIIQEKELSSVHQPVPWFQMLGKIFSPLKDRQFWLIALIGCLLVMPMLGLGEVWLVPYFLHTGKLAYASAPLAVGMLFLGWAFGAPIAGYMSKFFDSRLFIVSAGAVAATILLAIVLYVPNLSFAMICVMLFLFGFFNSTQILVYVIGTEKVPVRFKGMSTALIHMILMLAGFSIYLIGFLLEFMWGGHLLNGLHLYKNESYQLAFLVFPIASFLGFFLCFFLKEE